MSVEVISKANAALGLLRRDKVEGYTMIWRGKMEVMPYQPLLLGGEWTPGLRECHARFDLFVDVLTKLHVLPRTGGSQGRYMDVGSNSGYFVKNFAKHFDEVCGLEQDPYYIELVDALYPELSPAIRQVDVNTSGWELSFQDLQWDAITALSMIEYVVDKEQFMRTLHGLLAPGGVCLVEGHSEDLANGNAILYERILRSLPWDVACLPERTDPGRNAPPESTGRPVWVCAKRVS